MGFRMRRISRHAFFELSQSHIGETIAKTNAIRDPGQTPAAAGTGGGGAFEGGFLRLLLAVTDEDLITSLGELGPVLLQAVQNDEVGVVHHRTTEFLHVVSASLLLLRRSAALLLLGDGPAGDRQRQQSGDEERFTHCVPLILTAKILTAEIF